MGTHTFNNTRRLFFYLLFFLAFCVPSTEHSTPVLTRSPLMVCWEESVDNQLVAPFCVALIWRESRKSVRRTLVFKIQGEWIVKEETSSYCTPMSSRASGPVGWWACFPIAFPLLGNRVAESAITMKECAVCTPNTLLCCVPLLLVQRALAQGSVCWPRPALCLRTSFLVLQSQLDCNCNSTVLPSFSVSVIISSAEECQ